MATPRRTAKADRQVGARPRGPPAEPYHSGLRHRRSDEVQAGFMDLPVSWTPGDAALATSGHRFGVEKPKPLMDDDVPSPGARRRPAGHHLQVAGEAAAEEKAGPGHMWRRCHQDKPPPTPTPRQLGGGSRLGSGVVGVERQAHDLEGLRGAAEALDGWHVGVAGEDDGGATPRRSSSRAVARRSSRPRGYGVARAGRHDSVIRDERRGGQERSPTA